MPQISVIVPVYKVEPYLRRCVDSILAQTFTDFELILVDDGSPDGCPAICDEYAEKDNRVHVIHQQNGGLSAARNAGIDWAFANSTSQWIYFVDSDDWIHPMSLEALINGAKETGFDVVVSGYQDAEGENSIVETVKLAAIKWDTGAFFCEHYINAVVAWGKLYRKRCFREIRYPVGKLHEDEFVTYKILFEYDEVAVIDQPLYAYFQNPEGITGLRWKPSRLLAVEALNERAQYFIERNDRKMIQWSLQTMFENMCWQIKEIEKSDLKTQRAYRESTILQYKTLFRQYRKFLPFSENTNIYEVVYPRFVRMYYRLCHAKKMGLVGTITRIKEKWSGRHCHK